MRAFHLALIAVALFPMAFGQAVAEYGAVLSGSATGGTALGSAVGRSTSRAAGTLRGAPSASSSPHGIASVPNQRAREDTLAAAMRANRQKLDASAGTNAATVQIASVPGKTAVYVDGLAIAYAPTDLRLPAGKHALELRHPAFLAWRQELSVMAGQTVRLEPKLINPNKNQVIVSFDRN